MFSPEIANALFGALGDQSEQRASIAKTALSRASDKVVNKDYEGAVLDLERAIAVDPRGDNAAGAYDLLASVQMQLGNESAAIKAYEAIIDLDNTNDAPHLKLGNLYYGRKDYESAEKEYSLAVRLSPASSTDLFSLGQVYLATGRLDQAEATFRKVIAMAPAEHGGYYALGQTLAKAGRSKEAVTEFETTLRLKSDFDAARVDLGAAYVDMGDFRSANEQVTLLSAKSSSYTAVLQETINKATDPQIRGAYSKDGFIAALGPETSLTTLDDAFATPGATKELSLSFFFSKVMDQHSVENPFNWSITRTALGSPAGAYNLNQPAPSTDTPISPVPSRIEYDKDSLTARVYFLIRQNDTGTGTLDPSHLMFRFAGIDAYGNAMDPGADQYNGISQVI